MLLDSGCSFGKLRPKSLLGSEEDDPGPVVAGTTWHRECGISAGHPHGPCQLPAPQDEGWSHSHSPALTQQGREQGRAERCCVTNVPLLLPTSHSLSSPPLCGHTRLPGGFPKPSLELLSSALREFTRGPAASARAAHSPPLFLTASH